jgi:carbonic anhydrase
MCNCKTNPVKWAPSGDMLNSYITCASGKQQSPINIPVPAALDLMSNSKPVENIHFSTKNAVVSMSSNLKFSCISNCSELKWEGATYNFVGVHFHGASSSPDL